MMAKHKNLISSPSPTPDQIAFGMKVVKALKPLFDEGIRKGYPAHELAYIIMLEGALLEGRHRLSLRRKATHG